MKFFKDPKKAKEFLEKVDPSTLVLAFDHDLDDSNEETKEYIFDDVEWPEGVDPKAKFKKP